MTTDNSSLDRMTATAVVWVISGVAAAFCVVLMIFFGDFGYTGPVFLGLLIWFGLGFLLMKTMVDLPPPPEVGFANVDMVKASAVPTAPTPSAPKSTAPIPTPPAPSAPIPSAPAQTVTPVSAPVEPTPAAPKVAKPAPEPAAAAPATDADKPAALSAARDGGPDDLKKIKGIGPKLEGLLHRMGFYHFDQIAVWSDREIAWVDENLEGFKGRVSRDEWVSQAKVLATGADTEFSKRS